MVLLRHPAWPWQPPHVRSLLDLAGTAYGIAMIVLVVAFIVSDMTPIAFCKWLVLILFAMGSALAVDGVLAMRTGFDRTWKKSRRDRAARLMGGAKVAAGIYAFLLVLVGIAL